MAERIAQLHLNCKEEIHGFERTTVAFNPPNIKKPPDLILEVSPLFKISTRQLNRRWLAF